MRDIKALIERIHIQALNGKVVIGEANKGFWTFYVRFASKIGNVLFSEENPNLPIIEISDYDRYIQKVGKYLEIAQDFYKKDKDYYELSSDTFLEKLYLDLLINSTYAQQRNMLSYVDLRTKMLENPLFESKFKLLGLFDADVESSISKNMSNLEAPYKFETKIKSDTEEFSLPKIVFGTIDDTVYIYAIQNKKHKQISAIAKKADRFFRKVNKNVEDETIESNVSPNALVALTIFLSWARKCGYKKVIAPDYLPIRYESNLTASLNRVSDFESKQEIQAKADRNQYNMTNKLMYTMLRYGLHFTSSEVSYNDILNQIEMKIKKQKDKDGNIIFDIDEMVDIREYEKIIKEKS